jgi:hypothetical protein
VNWKSLSTKSLENSYLEFYDYTGQSIKCIKKIFTSNVGKMFEIKEKDHLVVAFDNELPADKNETRLIIVDYIHFKEVTRIPVDLNSDDYCFDLYFDSLLFLSGKGQLYQINMYKNYEIQTKIDMKHSVGKFLYVIEDKQIIVVDNETKFENKLGKLLRRGGLTIHTFQNKLHLKEGV